MWSTYSIAFDRISFIFKNKIIKVVGNVITLAAIIGNDLIKNP